MHALLSVVEAGVSSVHTPATSWKPPTLTVVGGVGVLTFLQSATHSLPRVTDIPVAAVLQSAFFVSALVQISASTLQKGVAGIATQIGSSGNVHLVVAPTSERNWPWRNITSGTGVTVAANESETA
jgi:hypothetical protein